MAVSGPFFRALVVYRCKVCSVNGADADIQAARDTAVRGGCSFAAKLNWPLLGVPANRRSGVRISPAEPLFRRRDLIFPGDENSGRQWTQVPAPKGRAEDLSYRKSPHCLPGIAFGGFCFSSSCRTWTAFSICMSRPWK
jgi:hypothetical protein